MRWQRIVLFVWVVKRKNIVTMLKREEKRYWDPIFGKFKFCVLFPTNTPKFLVDESMEEEERL